MPVYVKRMQDLLPQMRKGFTLLTDLSGLDSMEIECMTGIAKIMEACKAKGVGIVVRIIPDPHKDIGFNILSIVHFGRGIPIITCKTAEEAERAMNKAK
jgi:hypothetical protein